MFDKGLEKNMIRNLSEIRRTSKLPKKAIIQFQPTYNQFLKGEKQRGKRIN